MPTVKSEAIQLIRGLPEGISWDDIIYEIYVKKKIEKGIQAAEKGKTVSHRKVKELFSSK